MSNTLIEWLSVEAMRKGNHVILTGYGPDSEEKDITVSAGYLREILEVSAERFMERFGDDSKFLLQLFKTLLTD